MGVTIHFNGIATNEEAVTKIIDTAKRFAISNSMPYRLIDEQHGQISRVINEISTEYTGRVRGIAIEPHYNSEQLKLEFGDDLILCDYCKTQFAPAEVHISIVKFFKSIQSQFSKFDIIDEGEYWETEDLITLENRRGYCYEQIEAIKKRSTNAKGPVRLNNGRIADYVIIE
ncbi:MAG: hypothetical protein KDC07_08350 [Chitinophagaceae bacterium]|nr:hypothetical protein [Chitinophagaceae bacterium]MCB9046416.1 hypothetical protein [Chitinophagales bacterium]